jgi:AraC-like DNA-binding protein
VRPEAEGSQFFVKGGLSDECESTNYKPSSPATAVGAARRSNKEKGSNSGLLSMLVLASDLARRWTLAEIAAEVRGSPVCLTQVFQQVEGIPLYRLYRYQLRLRLARALDLIAHYDDLTDMSQDLGFSSHSHFSATFREAYGRSPSEFRRSALSR